MISLYSADSRRTTALTAGRTRGSGAASARPSRAPPLARGVVLDLVAPDPADREVPRGGMPEVEPADARPRKRGVRLREREPGARRRRAARRASTSRSGRGTPGSRTPAGSRDSARPTRSSVSRCSLGRVPGAARLLVEPLGERLGEPVGERLHHDRAVVVALRLERRRRARRRRGCRPRSRRCGRRGPSRPARRSPRASDSGGSRRALPAGGASGSGRRRCPSRARCRPLGGRGPEAVHAAGDEELLGDDPIEQGVRRLEQVARGRALLRMLEDRRIPPLQVPGVEEERPVDVAAELGERRLDEARADERRHREVVGVPR